MPPIGVMFLDTPSGEPEQRRNSSESLEIPRDKSLGYLYKLPAESVGSAWESMGNLYKSFGNRCEILIGIPANPYWDIPIGSFLESLWIPNVGNRLIKKMKKQINKKISLPSPVIQINRLIKGLLPAS